MIIASHAGAEVLVKKILPMTGMSANPGILV